jgi:hypothetical protein
MKTSGCSDVRRPLSDGTDTAIGISMEFNDRLESGDLLDRNAFPVQGGTPCRGYGTMAS